MPKFRKKPVVVEAVKLTSRILDNSDCPQWIRDAQSVGNIVFRINVASLNIVQADIITLEGVMVANVGDYIIKGVNGELYPCKPDIFEKTYEKVEE